MRTVVCVLLCLLFGKLQAQNEPYKLQNYRPASPNAFQFQKFLEMPVSEYTGTPSVSIPLFQLEEDGVTVPLNLTYHGGGIRVSEEASWVGLGWSLTPYGSIVQEISDRDDYEAGTVRVRPDWNESPIPSMYVQKYINPKYATTNPGWNNPEPLVPAKPLYSYRIYCAYPLYISSNGYWQSSQVAHAYLLPINTNRDNQPAATDVVEHTYYDSEPDIFTANFLGHSIKFMRDPQGSGVNVLNKKGYKVNRSGDVYQITAPTGDQFHFELNSATESYSTTVGGIGGGSSSPQTPVSKVWVLTKIITKNKREILFQYSQSGIVFNYPSYSEKWNVVTSTETGTFFSGEIDGYYQYPPSGLGKTYSYSKENRLTLSSIVFPGGQVDFITSGRDDILGGKKLDRIQVRTSRVVKSYQLGYDYINSSTVGGNKFQPDAPGSYGNPDLRLKLVSVQDNSGAVYSFSYSDIALPSKNSLAQDFWGFYNGHLSNSSLIPNPARLNAVQLSGVTGLADNGNNNSAHETFSQAGSLTSIRYPTGGRVTLEYQLNEFDNYWVPDFATTANQTSKGNGLRIRALNFEAEDNVRSKRTVYSYSGGKAMLPLQLSRQIRVTSIQSFPTGSSSGGFNTYQILEMNAKGFYSTNALGSGSSVGYNKVTREEVDGVGVSLGRTETFFSNNPDDITSSTTSSHLVNAALPVKKKLYRSDNSLYSENGLVDSVLVYNTANRLVKKVVNSYQTRETDIYYGARIFAYSTLYYQGGAIPRALCGYYPIYDKESFLSRVLTTEYADNNTALETKVEYSYDAYGQLYSKSQALSPNGSSSIEYYSQPYTDDASRPGIAALRNENRLTEVTGIRSVKYPSYTELYQVSKEYATSGSNTVLSKVVVTQQPGLRQERSVITYDQYDGYANPLQVTKEGQSSSMLWDYHGKYLMAEVLNAPLAEVAYTSFEAETKGNWTYGGNPASTIGVTGSAAYLLDGTNAVSKGGLNPGTTYTVSYWTKNPYPLSIAGTLSGSIVTGATVKGWTCFEHRVSGVSVVTLNGSGWIDEVRLCPLTAQMTTYTYQPLVGLSASVDLNNRITYYEYDVSGRLVYVKDQQQNILKKFCYNYKGQAENCLVDTAPQWQYTDNYRCVVNAEGAYTGYQERQQVDSNPTSPSFGVTRWVDNGYNTSACPLPVSCDYYSCDAVGPEFKCVEGMCEAGYRVYTYSYYDYGAGMWLCTYHFEWSDGSWSQDYTEYSYGYCY